MTLLPPSWARLPLKEACDHIQYGYTASSSANVQGPRYLRITDIQEDRVDWSTVPRVVTPISGISKYRLQRGDIVFARSGATVGKSFLVEEDQDDAVFASYLIRVRCASNVLEPRFAAYYFKTSEYWQEIMQGATGTGQPNFNGTKLGQLLVPVPSRDEQKRIVAKLDSLFAKSRRAREELARVPRLVERYKQAVLAKAFSGELTADWQQSNSVPPMDATEFVLSRQRNVSLVAKDTTRGRDEKSAILLTDVSGALTPSST